MAGEASKGLDVLTQKLGPFPVLVWAGGGLVVWWLYRQHSGTASSATPGSTSGQTDPAGNVGDIDPATGYVYGTPEDLASLSDSGTSTGTTTSGSTTAGAYADDDAWGRAAVNYLVGLGVDPTAANEAVQQYLASQTLTTQQQADVNLAIQGIGSPPELPGPTGTAPAPVTTPPPATTTPPKGTTYATNPPAGLTVSGKTATTVSLKWNKCSNATGYTIAYSKTRGGQDHKATAPASQTSITIGNLMPATNWYFEVWADPTKAGGPHAGPILARTAQNDALAPLK